MSGLELEQSTLIVNVGVVFQELSWEGRVSGIDIIRNVIVSLCGGVNVET